MSTEDNKKPWMSKTIWYGVLLGLAGLFPPAQAVLAANPELATAVAGGVVIALRFLTKDSVVPPKK